ncbi:hypothetical protein KR215_002233, partial [Drosophila sulfurigaster]
YPIVLIKDLCQLPGKERCIFMVLVGMLFAIAFVGNIGTLFVNSRRKLRPFFRTCLLALACSDLLYSLSFTTAYVAHFNAPYLELWTLGHFMCSLVPFVNTATIMFSSLVLVAIASDRYMAIRRAASGIWNPSWLFCGLCVGGIMLTSFVCAVPLFVISGVKHIYLQSTDELVVSELQLASVCLGMTVMIEVYNMILLSLIFLPCIAGFFFLNGTIARRLWQRRHFQQQQQEQPQEKVKEEPRFVYLLSKPETTHAIMTAFSVAASMDIATSNSNIISNSNSKSTAMPQLSPAAAARVARHRRMVHVVILMMATFMCLRLPGWIFLILRLYGAFSSPVEWLLYFSFGLLNLTSSALNPIFYTFLSQTLRCLGKMKEQFRNFFCCCSRNPEKQSEMDLNPAMPKESTERSHRCFCCGVQVTWHCYPKACKVPTAPQLSPVEDHHEKTDEEGDDEDDDSNLSHFTGVTGEIFTIYKEKSVATMPNASMESNS